MKRFYWIHGPYESTGQGGCPKCLPEERLTVDKKERRTWPAAKPAATPPQ